MKRKHGSHPFAYWKCNKSLISNSLFVKISHFHYRWIHINCGATFGETKNSSCPWISLSIYCVYFRCLVLVFIGIYIDKWVHARNKCQQNGCMQTRYVNLLECFGGEYKEKRTNVSCKMAENWRQTRAMLQSGFVQRYFCGDRQRTLRHVCFPFRVHSNVIKIIQNKYRSALTPITSTKLPEKILLFFPLNSTKKLIFYTPSVDDWLLSLAISITSNYSANASLIGTKAICKCKLKILCGHAANEHIQCLRFLFAV